MAQAKLLDRVRRAMTQAGYAPATIETYIRRMVRFIGWAGLRHPADMGYAEINAYLIHLAVERRISPVTQNQALDALRVLYRVLGGLDDELLAGLRARTRRGLPETASRDEIWAVLNELTGRDWLMAIMVYGGGLTVGECAKLKTDNVDFEQKSITLNSRTTVLPDLAIEPLRQQVAMVETWPGNVSRYLFPSSRLHGGRCWHASPSSLQKALKAAVKRAGLTRRITPTSLRSSFALHLLEDGYDVRTVQELMGYKSVKNVMVFQRMLDTLGVRSPLDDMDSYTEKNRV